MPLNGVRRNSQKRDNSESSQTEMKEVLALKDENEESKIDLNPNSTEITYDRYY